MSELNFKVDRNKVYTYDLSSIKTQTLCIGKREEIEGLYKNIWATSVKELDGDTNFSGCNMYDGIYSYLKQDDSVGLLKMNNLECELIRDMYQRILDTVRHRMKIIALEGCESIQDYNEEFPEKAMKTHCFFHCGFEFVECLDFNDLIMTTIDYCLAIGRRVGVHIVIMGIQDICDLLDKRVHKFSDKLIFPSSDEDVLKKLMGINQFIENKCFLQTSSHDLELLDILTGGF